MQSGGGGGGGRRKSKQASKQKGKRRTDPLTECERGRQELNGRSLESRGCEPGTNTHTAGSEGHGWTGKWEGSKWLAGDGTAG